MSCITYVHNNPLISQMQISGTSCGGSLVNYIVSYGQSVCMDSSKPVINLNGLQISGSCLPITPTPTPTNGVYCYTSGLTYYTATYQCPNNDVDYLDQYGVIKVTIFKDLIPSGDHPNYTFTVTNGTEVESFEILRGQEFNEFIYPKVDFRYTDTGCTTTTLPDWTISNTGGLGVCSFVTPTPTPTKTPTNTPTPTMNPICPEQIIISAQTQTQFNGTYNRLYSYSGGTFQYFLRDIYNGTTTYDTPDNLGNYAVAYGRFSAGTYYTLYGLAGFPNGTNPAIQSYSINYNNSGYYTDVWPAGTSVSITGVEASGNLRLPRRGLNTGFGVSSYYISYPDICPTTTPTPTQTITPTRTQTPTPTITVTPSITNPCPNCNQFYFSAGTRSSGNSPTAWTGNY